MRTDRLNYHIGELFSRRARCFSRTERIDGRTSATGSLASRSISWGRAAPAALRCFFFKASKRDALRFSEFTMFLTACREGLGFILCF